MRPRALPDAFVAAIPQVVGRPLGERVWAALDLLHQRYYDLPPCLAGPADDGSYVLGWPLPDRDLQVIITLDALAWEYVGPEWMAWGETLGQPDLDTPESMRPFSSAMAEVIAEYAQLLKALPPGTELQ
jgi:hypothetical protein